jgi:hypothetical protein
MKNLIVASSLLALALLLAPRAAADQDPIGPVSLAFGQTLDQFFPNQVHSFPSVKVLQFTGMAEASGPPGIPAVLGIHFDYIDTNGNTQIVPLPNFYQEAVQPGAGLIPINAGPVVLPYCPPQVSIHFENLTPNTEILFQGIYDHTCVPIPEPTACVLLITGALCGVARPRQRARNQLHRNLSTNS